MKNGPMIASVAALLGDPARANIMTALMDGRALTVSELTEASGVTMQTTSGHLAKLGAANLLTTEKQGRHRYYRLSGTDVAEVLEALMGLAQRTGAVRVRTGPKDAALRQARVCYDHMAGERGVELFNSIRKNGFIVDDGGEPRLTEEGRLLFEEFGIDVATLEKGKRPVCRHCLDWSERRDHLAGALGAAILAKLVDRGWVRREEGRVLTFTAPGAEKFRRAFHLSD